MEGLMARTPCLQRLLYHLGALLVLLFGLTAAAQAQDPAQLDPDAPRHWSRILGLAERLAASEDLGEEDTGKLILELSTLRKEANDMRLTAQQKHKEQQNLLIVLGPPPAKDAPPERPEIVKQREEIGRRLALYDSLIKQAELADRRATALQQRLAAGRLEEMLLSLAQRGPLPFSGKALRDAENHLIALQQGWRARLDAPGERARWGRYLLAVLGCIVLTGLAGRLAGHVLAPRWGLDPRKDTPAHLFSQLASLLLRIILPYMLLAAGLALAWGGSMGGFSHADTPAAAGILGTLLVGTLGIHLTRASLAPAHPAWRIVPVLDRPARRLAGRVGLLIGAVALTIAIRQALLHSLGGTTEPAALLAERSTWSDLLLGLLTLNCLRDRDWGGGIGWRWLRRLCAAVVFASIASHATGYHHLGFYMIGNLLVSALFITLLMFVRLLPLSLLGTRNPDGKDAHRLLNFWLMLAVDLALWCFGALVLLLIWGVPGAELRALGETFTLGITLGNITVSFRDLALTVVTFAVILTATRLWQRLLEHRLLPNTQLDASARSAIISFSGYLGLLLALAGASIAFGLDLTNLAIVAGALSVGIGFGLQNIVNNFVSGLIINVERPIRLGDWVTLGTLEGTVKRIGARATEIETFQRATVIIPNADILQQAVVNWVHTDTLGRVDIPVSVAYESPIADVEATLRNCAGANEAVLENPEPEVLFMGFGDNALNFELRVHVYDIRNNRMRVASDLRKAILRAFESAGIRIPFPQREVRVVQTADVNSAAAAAGA
jgi:small-conductance mechanosensitive channel